MNDARQPFFIGWARIPPGLRGFLAVCAFALVLVFAAAGYLVAATMDDPGSGAFRYDWGKQTLIGRLETRPYPLLHVVQSKRYPAGTTIMLSGGGKRGVQARAAALDGQIVQASGVMLARGDLAMLQVAGAPSAFVVAKGRQPTAGEVLPLGRWRLSGEICDGKCYTGAMRPGSGLAHKACANLCLIGGVPPVFVSSSPVDGDRFLLMADADGGPVTDSILDHVATLVDVEGEIERRGSMLVFKIAPDTLRFLR
ncbi:MAG: hypothetical protein ACI8W7_004430 [Gammaproteobacteria bacterium]